MAGRRSPKLARAGPEASPLFRGISSDRLVGSRTDERERDRKQGTRRFECQSRTSRGWSAPALSFFCTLDKVACETCS
jgi:hypothetical protein